MGGMFAGMAFIVMLAAAAWYGWITYRKNKIAEYLKNHRVKMVKRVEHAMKMEACQTMTPEDENILETVKEAAEFERKKCATGHDPAAVETRDYDDPGVMGPPVYYKVRDYYNQARTNLLTKRMDPQFAAAICARVKESSKKNHKA